MVKSEPKALKNITVFFKNNFDFVKSDNFCIWFLNDIGKQSHQYITGLILKTKSIKMTVDIVLSNPIILNDTLITIFCKKKNDGDILAFLSANGKFIMRVSQ